MKRWEYTFTYCINMDAFMEELDELGQKGWELVAVTSPTCDKDGESVHYPTAYLKRETLIEPKPLTTEEGVCL